jgi:WD40 repeat protein
MGYDKFFVLRNGDIVKGNSYLGFILQTFDSRTAQLKKNFDSPYRFPNFFGQLSNGDLIVGYKDSFLANGTTLLVWNLTKSSGEAKKRSIQTNQDISCLTVLNNDHLAIGEADGDIVIIDSVDGTEKKRLMGHTSTVNQIIESQSGLLVSCSDDRTVKLWDLSQNKYFKTFSFNSEVMSITILNNGYLASGLFSETVEIINLETESFVQALHGHNSSICNVNCLQVLPNGDLISASFDKSINVWNLSDGTLKSSHNQHKFSINQLDILPNGNIISASGNEILIWS